MRQPLLHFFGHASFGIAGESTWLLTDPWYSSTGAYGGAWFQFPKNHHALSIVRELDADKAKYVYVSHDHKDHCDERVLSSLAEDGYHAVIPKFYTSSKLDHVIDSIFEPPRITRLDDKETLDLGDMQLTIFTAEEGINCDSAVLVKGAFGSFLNLNDCKIFDRIEYIQQHYGNIDVFTVQYSGASMHPICYEFEASEYKKVSRTKRRRKLNAVRNAVKKLNPDFYIPSAGPAVFLDDSLYEVNFDDDSVFPKPWDVSAYLEKGTDTKVVTLDVGGTLDIESGEIELASPQAISRENLRQYLDSYRQAVVRSAPKHRSMADVSSQLLQNLNDKLAKIPEQGHLSTDLYFVVKDDAGDKRRVLRCPKGRNKALEVSLDDVPDTNRVVMTATLAAWTELFEIHNGNWEDFCLSFRFTISRRPDAYDTATNIFLFSSVDDIEKRWLQNLRVVENTERIVVDANGKRYEINRYCPHAGADLTYAHFEDNCLICPRHQWRYDLSAGGHNAESGLSIEAHCVEGRSSTSEPTKQACHRHASNQSKS